MKKKLMILSLCCCLFVAICGVFSSCMLNEPEQPSTSKNSAVNGDKDPWTGNY